MMPEKIRQVAAAVKRGAERLGEALDRWAMCPDCKHNVNTRGCPCQRDDCACSGRGL